LDITHFLQAPNRKIQRVNLLFEAIVKNTEETNRDREILQKAMDELKDIVFECDARYHPEPTDHLSLHYITH